MKKFILSICLFLIALASLQAQTYTVHVKGQLVSSTINAPVPNHTVEIYSDSSVSGFAYYASVQTNNSGYYVKPVSIPVNQIIVFVVSTTDCNGIVHTVTDTVSGTHFIANFSICTNQPPPPCHAQFTISPVSGNPLEFVFHNTSLGGPAQFLWTFGDGDSSTLASLHHTYAQPGTYVVCLVMVTASGCTDTICKQIIVQNPPPPPPCHAAFTTNTWNLNPMQVKFINASSGGPAQFFWDFGDGGTSTLTNPLHTYAQAGTYQVCLVMITASGCTDTTCHQVVVQGPPPPPACHASFTIHHTSVNPLLISFQNTSVGLPAQFFWTFGDGDTSTAQSPHHIYTQPGTYQVCLVMVAASGCTDTICKNLQLFVPPPPPPCHGFFHFIKQGLTVNFHAHAGGGLPPYSFAWDFGDGGTSTLHNPVYTYAVPGTYTVTMTLTSSDSCVATYTKNITVFVPNPGPFDIYGHVFAGPFPLTSGWVILYTPDVVTNNGLILVDSTQLNSQGAYQFSQVAAGLYFIRAFPSPGSGFDTLFKPTFYPHNTYPGYHSLVHLGPPHNPYNIHLKHKHPWDGMVDSYADDEPGYPDTPYEKNSQGSPVLRLIAAYPNPANDFITLEMDLPLAASAEVSLFSILGQQVLSQSFSLDKGTQLIQLETDGVNPGVYTLSIRTGEGSRVQEKVLIAR